MKRITSLLIITGLLCFLIGCGTESPVPVQTDPSVNFLPESLPEGSTADPDSYTPYHLPLIAASTVPMEEVFPSEDGNILLEYAYQDLVLLIDDPQIANAVAMDFLNLVDPAGASVSAIVKDAQREYKNAEKWSPYRFQRFFTPMRLDRGILSLYGLQTLSGGLGGASTAEISVTYDLLTGFPLSLTQILREDNSMEALTGCIVDSLSGMAVEGRLFGDYAYTVEERFLSNTPVENWYLSDRGLCFYFSPYEIAPYSEGTVLAEIPYSRLSGILKDEYFPEESVDLAGTLRMTEFEGTQPDLFSGFSELILNNEGTEYLICTTGAVKNVRVEIGTTLADGTFIPEVTVFSASTLCQDDALIIRLSDAMLQNLRITYTSAGQAYAVSPSSLLTFG